MSELNERERTLVAIGAAVASNCAPCVEYHIPEARRAGCGDAQIREAVRIADKVRRVPARLVLHTALARIEQEPQRSTGTDAAGCGCSGSRKSTHVG